MHANYICDLYHIWYKISPEMEKIFYGGSGGSIGALWRGGTAHQSASTAMVDLSAFDSRVVPNDLSLLRLAQSTSVVSFAQTLIIFAYTTNLLCFKLT